MKRLILIPAVLASTMFFTGCASLIFDAVTGATCGSESRCGYSSQCGADSASGIDPVTQAAIDASNQATSEAIQ
jgi:hypothetical protein